MFDKPTELFRPSLASSFLTNVTDHSPVVSSSEPSVISGQRFEITSCRWFFPQNGKAPVPPILNFPCTNGTFNLLLLLIERIVSGIDLGDCPSPRSTIMIFSSPRRFPVAASIMLLDIVFLVFESIVIIRPC